MGRARDKILFTLGRKTNILKSTGHVRAALFHGLGALYDEEKLVHRLVGALRSDLKDPNA